MYRVVQLAPLHMDAQLTNDYLARAREILGDRTDTEIEYDNTVVAFLTKGMDIKSAVDAANREHPDEALNPIRLTGRIWRPVTITSASTN